MRLSPPLASLPLLVLMIAGCTENTIYKLEGDDVFYQNPAGEVDVLLVIDNSCSMQPYQNKLATNFNEFLTYFVEGDVDYHIGVVTTSVQEPYAYSLTCDDDAVAEIPPAGELVQGTYITPETDNGSDLFSDMVKVGTCGSYYEMGMESAFRAVTEPIVSDVNAGFLREEAYLSMIFVSDEQDASPMDVAHYVNAFREVKGQRNRDIFNASALVVTDSTECDAASFAGTDGTRYVDLATQANGVVASICSDDFGAIVTELSLATSRLTDTFYLSSLPDPSTLIVSVNGEEVPCEDGTWTYETQTVEGVETGVIIFDRAAMPPPQSDVSVQYKYGSGDVTAFCQ